MNPNDGSIRTYSGLRFKPLDPDPALIRIEDIAHSLANQCRFGGHCRVFYSVAQHSVRVSELCSGTVQEKRAAILHDASESLLCDVPSPIKQLPEFAAYRRAEHRLQAIIFERFGLPAEQPQSVTSADERLLKIEKRELFDIESGESVSEQEFWSPIVAEERFLQQFRQLTDRIACELGR